jgi:PTH1 family peptidyl-tRNA hydrolase
MKVVVGLGNPGRRYEGTRHNVGFRVVDGLGLGQGPVATRHVFQADIAEVTEAGEKILLVKPATFMNLSGQCVRQVVDFYQLPLVHLLVVCDDINLPLGKLRFRARGTHGGHNGLRDIQNHLGSTAYPRLRIGVGAPPEEDAIGHVLGRFRPSERPAIDDAIASGVEAVLFWIREGIAKSMNQYNG